MRYSRAWDRSNRRSAWILVNNNITPISPQEHPWIKVLEQNRIERKWQVSKRYDSKYPTYSAQLTAEFKESNTNAFGGSYTTNSSSFHNRGMGGGAHKWDSDAWMKGLIRLPTGGLKGKLKKRQTTDIAKDFFKSKALILSSALDLKMAMAVLSSEPISRLQRISQGFVYAPNFLMAAASATDPIHRFELVMAFVVAGIHFGARPTRPFEPLVGETLQAALHDGSQIYLEQLSSTPSTCSFEMASPWRSKSKNERSLSGFGRDVQKDAKLNIGNQTVNRSNGDDGDDDGNNGNGDDIDSGLISGISENDEEEEDEDVVSMIDSSDSEEESSEDENQSGRKKVSNASDPRGSKESSWSLSGTFEHITTWQKNTIFLSNKVRKKFKYIFFYRETNKIVVSEN